jgi:hypothetical protein
MTGGEEGEEGERQGTGGDKGDVEQRIDVGTGSLSGVEAMRR